MFRKRLPFNRNKNLATGYFNAKVGDIKSLKRRHKRCPCDADGIAGKGFCAHDRTRAAAGSFPVHNQSEIQRHIRGLDCDQRQTNSGDGCPDSLAAQTGRLSFRRPLADSSHSHSRPHHHHEQRYRPRPAGIPQRWAKTPETANRACVTASHCPAGWSRDLTQQRRMKTAQELSQKTTHTKIFFSLMVPILNSSTAPADTESYPSSQPDSTGSCGFFRPLHFQKALKLTLQIGRNVFGVGQAHVEQGEIEVLGRGDHPP